MSHSHFQPPRKPASKAPIIIVMVLCGGGLACLFCVLTGVVVWFTMANQQTASNIKPSMAGKNVIEVNPRNNGSTTFSSGTGTSSNPFNSGVRESFEEVRKRQKIESLKRSLKWEVDSIARTEKRRDDMIERQNNSRAPAGFYDSIIERIDKELEESQEKIEKIEEELAELGG